MGFYLRKSLNVGPFRFSLNKSGIGLSTGIRGFRVGTGPRGDYVHMQQLRCEHRVPRSRTRPDGPLPALRTGNTRVQPARRNSPVTTTTPA